MRHFVIQVLGNVKMVQRHKAAQGIQSCCQCFVLHRVRRVWFERSATAIRHCTTHWHTLHSSTEDGSLPSTVSLAPRARSRVPRLKHPAQHHLRIVASCCCRQSLTNQHIVITSDHSKGWACFLCTAHPHYTKCSTSNSKLSKENDAAAAYLPQRMPPDCTLHLIQE